MGNKDQFISASAAWRYFFPMVSQDTVERMFSEKKIKSSFQPSGKRGHWFALRSEVREYAQNITLTRQDQ